MWFTICQSSHPTRKAFNSLSMDFKTHYDTLRRDGLEDIDALSLSKDGLSSMRHCRCPALSLQTELSQNSRECKVHNPVYAKLIKRKQKTKKNKNQKDTTENLVLSWRFKCSCRYRIKDLTKASKLSLAAIPTYLCYIVYAYCNSRGNIVWEYGRFSLLQTWSLSDACCRLL